MAVTPTQLVDRFPEFQPALTEYPDLVQDSIDNAELMIDRAFYGAKADMAVKYLAAHLIATNPLGEFARLDKKGPETVYLKQFEMIKRTIGAGCRVI